MGALALGPHPAFPAPTPSPHSGGCREGWGLAAVAGTGALRRLRPQQGHSAPDAQRHVLPVSDDFSNLALIPDHLCEKLQSGCPVRWQMEANQGTETKWHCVGGRGPLNRATSSSCATNKRGGGKSRPRAKQLSLSLQGLGPYHARHHPQATAASVEWRCPRGVRALCPALVPVSLPFLWKIAKGPGAVQTQSPREPASRS